MTESLTERYARLVERIKTLRTQQSTIAADLTRAVSELRGVHDLIAAGRRQSPRPAPPPPPPPPPAGDDLGDHQADAVQLEQPAQAADPPPAEPPAELPPPSYRESGRKRR